MKSGKGKKLMIITGSIGKSMLENALCESGFEEKVEIIESEEIVKELVKVKSPDLPILVGESLGSQLKNYTKQPKLQYEDKVQKDRMKYAKRR